MVDDLIEQRLQRGKTRLAGVMLLADERDQI